MALLDGGTVEGDGSDALDGGTVSQTGPEGSTNPYGVTVQQVRELATHVGFDPALDDPDFGPTRKSITDPMIAHWIMLVTQSVTTRAATLVRFRDNTERWAVIQGAAATAITNGAASYLVAAAFPAKAGTNDQTSYSAELWRRYESELDLLVSLGSVFDADDAATGDGAAAGVSPRASYTPPSVPRGSGFFATDPYNAVRQLDQNRMNPRTGGYPAPGAEGYR
jgi:hypothetical protein